MAHHYRVWPFLLVLALVASSLASATNTPATLTVTTEDAQLYAQQDIESKVVATLARGEVLKPLAQGVGTGVWYMVKTSKGYVGWIQAVDVTSTQRTDEVFRDRSEVSAKDVTPKAQAEVNTENARREAEERASAEARAAAAERRAAEHERARIREQAALERERIRAQAAVEAAKKQSTCVNCILLR